MTRILVQRGSASGSSVNPNRSSSLSGTSSSSSSSFSSSSSSSSSSSPPFPSPSSSARVEPQISSSSSTTTSQVKNDGTGEEVQEQAARDEVLEHFGSSDSKVPNSGDLSVGSFSRDWTEISNEDNLNGHKDDSVDIVGSGELMNGLGGLRISESLAIHNEGTSNDSSSAAIGSSHPPPPPLPPPKPIAMNTNSRRAGPGSSNAVRVGSSRRGTAWPLFSTRNLPTESRPSSPRSHIESDGYNSADEQNPCFSSSYDDIERERQFEIEIRRSKGLEVRRMLEDGNCLFRAVADQVYGDSEAYDLIRQMCVDYMERERDHFSQFITEGFTSYCKRKRRDKVYGNNVEIQALAEMYNRPIHIYSYSMEPINIFHGSYNTDTPPIRLSYHHGNHYNSLVDPRCLTIGAGLGFSSLRGRNVDKDQVKAAIKAQQDQQIDSALLAEGRYYSDLEITEKEIERMVMEVSRAEYLTGDTFKHQIGLRESSTSGAEPSSSAARPCGSETKLECGTGGRIEEAVPSRSMQMVLSMGFSYLQVIEAYSIFGDDVDSMVCYLLETGSSSNSRRKGKAAE